MYVIGGDGGWQLLGGVTTHRFEKFSYLINTMCIIVKKFIIKNIAQSLAFFGTLFIDG